MNNTTVVFMEFDEWKKVNADLPSEFGDDLLVNDCSECDGTGMHECECGSLHSCGFCSGTGREFGQDEDAVLKKAYQEQLDRDQVMLKKWTERAVAS